MKTSTSRALSAALVAGGIAAVAASAGAQTPGGAPAPGASPVQKSQTVIDPMARMPAPPPTSDADFVRTIDASNNAEIAEARLALRRSKNPNVRQFAQHMIDDHTTAQVELRAAAQAAGPRYAIPVRAVKPAARAEYRMLAMASDAQFDKMYMAGQVPDHVDALNAVQWEAQNGRDPSLKQYAMRLIQPVRSHALMAQTFLASNGASINPEGSTADAANAAARGTIAPPANPAQSGNNGTPSNNSATSGNGQSSGTNNGQGLGNRPPLNRSGNPSLTPNGTPVPQPSGSPSPPPQPGTAPVSPGPSPSP